MGVVVALATCGAVGPAQAQNPRRIVVLIYSAPEEHSVRRNVELFREGLASEGFLEARDYTIELVQVPAGKDLGERARSAVTSDTALVVALTTRIAQAAAREVRGAPVLFGLVSDPVASGIVSNLARPGGNVTGVSNMVAELSGKVLELTLELVPGAKRLAVLWNSQRF